MYTTLNGLRTFNIVGFQAEDGIAVFGGLLKLFKLYFCKKKGDHPLAELSSNKLVYSFIIINVRLVMQLIKPTYVRKLRHWLDLLFFMPNSLKQQQG